jgi:hypothetical protein
VLLGLMDLGFQNDLDTGVILVVEHFEPIGRLFERERVSDDEARIDLSLLNAFE